MKVYEDYYTTVVRIVTDDGRVIECGDWRAAIDMLNQILATAKR